MCSTARVSCRGAEVVAFQRSDCHLLYWVFYEMVVSGQGEGVDSFLFRPPSVTASSQAVALVVAHHTLCITSAVEMRPRLVSRNHCVRRHTNFVEVEWAIVLSNSLLPSCVT